MDVIEEIYQNSIQPSENNMHIDKVYRNAKHEVKQNYQRLCQKLTQEETGILNKLMSRYQTVLERKNVYCFTEGFKKGLKVALKSLK